MTAPHLRVARPTNRLDELVAQYQAGLGLEELGRFTDHDGFDGVMLGHPGAGYHLELTRQRGEKAGGKPSTEHLLVFYEPDAEVFAARCDAMDEADFIEVPAHNPYWDRRGRTFVDLDGYRVVIQQAHWPPR
jgi:hypothetical protein